jgi:hypothetical protein
LRKPKLVSIRGGCPLSLESGIFNSIALTRIKEDVAAIAIFAFIGRNRDGASLTDVEAFR